MTLQKSVSLSGFCHGWKGDVQFDTTAQAIDGFYSRQPSTGKIDNFEPSETR